MWSGVAFFGDGEVAACAPLLLVEKPGVDAETTCGRSTEDATFTPIDFMLRLNEFIIILLINIVFIILYFHI